LRWDLIGERIETLRRKHDLSQVQFGKTIGVTGQYLSQVEKGSRGMSVESIVNICNSMGVTSDYLLFGASDPTEAISALNGLSRDQIELVLDIVKNVAQFINSENGNEVLTKALMRQQSATAV